MSANTPLTQQLERSDGDRRATIEHGNYLQDTTAWGAPHKLYGKPPANFLMSDGSIRVCHDENGDGFLNPGFSVPEDLPEAQRAAWKYRDGTVELTPTEIFSEFFLLDVRPRAHFACE